MKYKNPAKKKKNVRQFAQKLASARETTIYIRTRTKRLDRLIKILLEYFIKTVDNLMYV